MGEWKHRPKLQSIYLGVVHCNTLASNLFWWLIHFQAEFKMLLLVKVRILNDV